MKGKIINLGPIQSGDSQYGKWFSAKIVLENGDSGKMFENKSSRMLDSLFIGADVEYEIEAGAKGNKITVTGLLGGTVPNPAKNSNNSVTSSIIRQVAFKGAVEVVVSNATATDIDDIVRQVASLTNRFEEIIISGDVKENMEKIMEV